MPIHTGATATRRARSASLSELPSLGEHLNTCRNQHGPLSRVQSLAESMHGFVSARFVTTLVVAIVAIAVVVGLTQLVA